jgi:hypothetical protein
VEIMMLFHVSVLSQGARTVFPAGVDRLRAVRRLASHLGGRSLWFCLADTHLHEVVEASADEIPFVLRDLRFVLEGLAGDVFQVPHSKEIADQRHLENCWRYVVSNNQQHGVNRGPIDDGSGLADVVGARWLPGFEADRWQRHLPRRSLGDLLRQLDIPPAAATPATREVVRAIGAVHLARLAAGAVGWPDLHGNSPAVAAARSAAMRLGLDAGLARSDLGYALDIARQTTYAVAAREHPVLEAVVRRRISFEAAVSQTERPAVARAV